MQRIPTEAEVDHATRIMRQASTGTMVLDGKRLTPLMVRKAKVTYGAWLDARPAPTPMTAYDYSAAWQSDRCPDHGHPWNVAGLCPTLDCFRCATDPDDELARTQAAEAARMIAGLNPDPRTCLVCREQPVEPGQHVCANNRCQRDGATR